MKNTYSIFSYGNEFICTQTATGITITNPLKNDEHIGDIDGISIPELDEHEDTVVGFMVEVQNWLETNYW
jgi:hypothetical protein